MTADIAAWAALGVSVLGSLPRLISTLTRSSTESRRTDVARFEALYDKQDRLIARLEDRCDELEQQLAVIRTPQPGEPRALVGSRFRNELGEPR